MIPRIPKPDPDPVEPGYCWTVDADGKTISCGRKLADWFGLSRRQLKAVSPIDLVFGADRGACRDAFAAAFYYREPFDARVRLFRRDGKLFWAIIAGIPLYQGVIFLGYRMIALTGDTWRSRNPGNPHAVSLGTPIRSVSLSPT